MRTSEMICKAAAYDMVVENGVERHVRSMTLSGQDTTGEPSTRARKGKFPNYEYKMSFDEALDFFNRYIGNCCVYGNWLSRGLSMTKAYSCYKTRKYADMNVGDVFFEIAFDIKNERGNVTRKKIVFTKA